MSDDRTPIRSIPPELAPEYDEHMADAVAYARGELGYRGAKAFRARMQSDATFRAAVMPVIESYAASPVGRENLQAAWQALGARVQAAGLAPIGSSTMADHNDERTHHELLMHSLVRNAARRWGVAAAIFIALIGLPFAINKYHEYADFDRISAPDNADVRVKLPDGSSIGLTPGSSVRYRHDLQNTALRTVQLWGDADFQVAHAPAPFEVRTPGARIAVTGTEFLIESGDNLTVVYVVEGTVIVQALDADGEPIGPVTRAGPHRLVRVRAGVVENRDWNSPPVRARQNMVKP